MTTNANLTGVVTSVGNATSIANSAITNAMLANAAVANLSGTNSGDQTDITGNAGTVTDGAYLSADQTFTGLNTFSSAVTAKGYANSSQSIVITSETSFAADGSGVVMMTFSGTAPIGTITGCSSGAVKQGQLVVFVASAWTVGGISFTDTTPAAAAADTMLLNGAAGTWTPPASAACLGAAITLMCTTVNTATPAAPNYVKLWVEIGRSLSGV